MVLFPFATNVIDSNFSIGFNVVGLNFDTAPLHVLDLDLETALIDGEPSAFVRFKMKTKSRVLLMVDYTKHAC